MTDLSLFPAACRAAGPAAGVLDRLVSQYAR